MSSVLLHLCLIGASITLFLSGFALNEWLFNSSYFSFAPGINWIYLPAGMRLLCTLLFGGAGAIGILIASWITCIFYFFPDDPVRALAGSVASAFAPYLIYKLAQYQYGLHSSLTNLTPLRLLALSVLYSLANPMLHHLWLLLHGDPVGSGFLVMVLGDLLGTLVVLYTIKGVLSLLNKRRLSQNPFRRA